MGKGVGTGGGEIEEGIIRDVNTQAMSHMY